MHATTEYYENRIDELEGTVDRLVEMLSYVQRENRRLRGKNDE